uniref:Centrosomal protein n=1 Tax=Anthurium amnicola TaxID=1678845 RepID=A0A1D1ZAJ1_9ARAE
MNDPSQMMNRSFVMWQPPMPPPPALDKALVFGNPRLVPPGSGVKPGWVNWKGKKAADKRKKAAAAGGVGGLSGYKPPTLGELQAQNRAKARRFYPKKKFARFAPLAPRNTTSFIIRAKKSGGIASLVSPCPVTPAILPTPKFSPSREGLVDMAKEEWGVDGYGSMKGLIRLRSPTANEMRGPGEEEDDADEGSGESDVEEHVEVERRLDHDLSRFEMVYPGGGAGEEHGATPAAAYLLENRVDDQDAHIAQLEEENLTLKERLFLMETEMGDLRRRMQLLEKECGAREDDAKDHDGSNNMEPHEEEASENEGGGDVSSEKSVGD